MYGVLALVVCVAGLGWSWVEIGRNQRSWKYAEREDELLVSHGILFRELVAHGKNSGGNIANFFSNSPGSLATSLGLFVTADTYIGSNGYSLRLKGLEEGVNDMAMDRAIVMHGASYVSRAWEDGSE